MKLHIGQYCFFLVIIFSCNITIAFAQRPQKETLPFTLNISCNNDYCDIAPSAGTSTASYEMILNDGILSTKKGIIYYCLSRNGNQDTLFIISIKDNQKTILDKIPLYNIDVGKLSIDSSESVFYLQAQRFNYYYRQPSTIDTTTISKALLTGNTILAISAHNHKIIDTIRSSVCDHYSYSLDGSIFSTIAGNGKISKCRWLPQGTAGVDTTNPKVFNIDNKPVLISDGDLMTYDMAQKELLSILVNTDGLERNPTGGILGYKIFQDSRSGMYISLRYKDKIKGIDGKTFSIWRRELVYYDKKSQKVQKLFALKCKPSDFLIKKKEGNYIGIVPTNEVLQENNKYLVYSVLGIDTGIHDNKANQSKFTQKDASGNVTDTLYQSFAYNHYYTVNAIISKETGKVLFTKTYKGFTVIRNNEEFDFSGEFKIWAIDKDLAPEYINTISCKGGRLMITIEKPDTISHPDKLIYRVYKN